MARQKSSKSKSTTRRSSTNGRDADSEVRQVKQPKSPMPAQHQAKPGKEHKLTPRPNYEAPLYKGSGKLKKKVALAFVYFASEIDSSYVTGEVLTLLGVETTAG